MAITYPERLENTAELIINGGPVRYQLPPKIGTHTACFTLDANEKGVRLPTAMEIVAYAHGALVHRKNEWANQDRIIFPTNNYLRFQNVLTIVPTDKKYGDLAGGMLVDFDEKGEGITMQTEVPKDLSGFRVDEAGLLVKDKRIFLPYNFWFKGQWDEKYAVAIALAGREGASLLEQTSRDSGRTYIPAWKVDPKTINLPAKCVPFLDSYSVDRLNLDCDDGGNDEYGCVPRVRIASA